MSTTKIPNSLLVSPGGSQPTVLISNNLTSQSTSSSTTVALTNLSISGVVTGGRPVLLQLVSTNGGLSRVSAADAAQIVFLRDGSPISEQHLRAAGTAISIPPSSYQHLDNPASGTYTYSVGFKSSTSTSTTVEHVKLIVIVL